MPGSNKDTIYVDIDDEITGIIDKVRGSKANLVALVLPKRAGVFQSIVNMKLLKRAADDAGKHLVLITSEAGLMPLAGAAGVHVAKTLSSKPEVPVAPKMDEGDDEAIDEAGEVTKDTAGEQPVGDLAKPSDEVETVELDNDDTGDKAKAAAAGAVAAGAAKKAKDSKAAKPKAKGKSGSRFKIPDFNKFRTKMLAAGGLAALFILALILGIFVLPKATINIKTDATKVPVELDLNLSTTATELETDNNTLPAKQVSIQKTYSQQVPTTGQKNQGNKASGSVTITNCGDGPVTIPAGTGFSAGGNTYINQQSVSVPVSTFLGKNGPCQNNGKATTTVQAQSGGSSYNLPSNSQFGISGVSSDLSAVGGTSGGSDNIVKTVNQNDINKARSQISANNDNVQKKALEKKLKDDKWFPISSTFNAGSPQTTQSAPVGAAANDVTVTETITYTMFGAHEKDLNKVVDNVAKDQIDTSKQVILSRGLDKAVFAVHGTTANGAQLTLQTDVEAGPDLDIASIKADARGQRPREVKAQLSDNPDVQDVEVKLSPFWVSTVPKKDSKIKVKIAEPTDTKGNDNASNP